MQIILTGTPPSTQHIYKYRYTGKFLMSYMSAEGKSAKEAYQWEMKSQFKNKTITGEIKLKVKYFFGTKRKHDIDNFTKLWLDAGTGIIWEDDGQIIELHLSKHYDKENPRIEMEIYGENEFQKLCDSYASR